MVDLKIGDIFVLPLPNQQYLFGRILLDVEQQCTQPNLITNDSPLSFYDGTILVEVYQEMSQQEQFHGSKILIPGFFIVPDLLQSKEWKIIANQSVDPLKVEFPETLSLFNGISCFQRGEIRLNLPQQLPDSQDWRIAPTLISPYALPKICLNHLGLTDFLKPVQLQTMNLRRFDLRFSEKRSQIYQILGEDENQSYSEMSSRLGYDITRFYQ